MHSGVSNAATIALRGDTLNTISHWTKD